MAPNAKKGRKEAERVAAEQRQRRGKALVVVLTSTVFLLLVLAGRAPEAAILPLIIKEFGSAFSDLGL
jgi:hypothetical protein